jgi:hypothetical protein
MKTPKEDIAPRVLALIHAQKTLLDENLMTPTISSKIRIRINEILERHPEINEIIAKFQRRVGKGYRDIRESVLAIIPVPEKIRHKLKGKSLIMLEALIESGNKKSGYVNDKALQKAVFGDEDIDDITFRTRVSLLRKEIEGWADVSRVTGPRGGKGYKLELVNKEATNTE